jgi:hypothetical protein
MTEPSSCVAGPAELGIQQLLGQYCWRVTACDQLNLWMYLGPPDGLEVLHEPYDTDATDPLARMMAAGRSVHVAGQWLWWVYVAFWTVLDKDRPLATTSSARRAQADATLLLDGQKLSDVRVDLRTGATVLWFDLGGVVKIRRRSRVSKDELWLLYDPDNRLLSVRGDGSICRYASEDRAEKRPARRP